MDGEKLNYCSNCHVYVDSSLRDCPLCRQHLTDTPDVNGMYAPVVESKTVDRRTYYDDVAIFLSFVFIVASILINLVTWTGSPWFLAVASSILLVWIVFKTSVGSKFCFGTKLFLQLLGVMALLLSIDYLAGWHRWSINYLLPFALIGCNVLLDVYFNLYRVRWKDNILYVLLFAILGCLPLLFCFAHITSALIPAILSAAASAVTIILLLSIAVRAFSSEMKKRFHV